MFATQPLQYNAYEVGRSIRKKKLDPDPSQQVAPLQDLFRLGFE